MIQSNSSPIEIQQLKVKPLTAILMTVLLIIFFAYILLPVISFRFPGWIVLFAIACIPLITIPRLRKLIIGLLVVFGCIVLVLYILSIPLFRASAYRNLIGNVDKTEFSELIQPVKIDQVPVVDRDFAASLAEKKLGDDFALGSRVELGKPTRQMVNNRLVWVVPLLHSGFFKWLTNAGSGTPGYIIVSATNPQDITFVRELNGKPIKIIYQPGAFFNQDIHRWIYLNGFITQGIGDFTFEITDSGEPYWTSTIFTHRIGVKGSDAVGIALVHATTGKVSYYPLVKDSTGWSDKLIPAWVDRVQPVEFVITQLNWWGQYVNGFWNSIFGKRDMLMTTEGYNIIYSADNHSYFYTGMSSVGADEGTVGFVLTDTRSKRTHLYRMSGATEYAAMTSAEGKVQNYKYRAMFPILLNINGLPTYFLTLKDSAGLVKMFAFVSVKDFSIVGVGESIKTAKDNYLMGLSNSRVGDFSTGATVKTSLTGTVSRIGESVKDGRTFYYFSLIEKPGLIFIATTDNSHLLPLTKQGDSVSINYIESTDSEVSISDFNNLSIK